jgi:hypothetical protein
MPCKRAKSPNFVQFAFGIVLGMTLATQSLADSDNVHAVPTACSDFTDYVKTHQAVLDKDVPPDDSGVRELDGAAGWNFQIGGLPALTFAVRDVKSSERFHCQCSGRDVENYERDCPIGLKCFGDFRCPPGQDCENHPCVSGDLPKLNITTNSVDVTRFHWAPPPSEAKQCKAAMIKYDTDVDAHELGHARQYRQDINQWIASHPASSFHRYECGSNVEAIEQQIAADIFQDLKSAIDLLEVKIELDTAQFHAEHGETIPPPDCSCVSQ